MVALKATIFLRYILGKKATRYSFAKACRQAKVRRGEERAFLFFVYRGLCLQVGSDLEDIQADCGADSFVTVDGFWYDQFGEFRLVYKGDQVA